MILRSKFAKQVEIKKINIALRAAGVLSMPVFNTQNEN
jgi:hypothetical protein